MGIGKYVGRIVKKFFEGDERAEAEEKLIRSHLSDWIRKYGNKYIAVSACDGIDFDSDEDDGVLRNRVRSEIQRRGRIIIINPSLYRDLLHDPISMSCGISSYSAIGGF